MMERRKIRVLKKIMLQTILMNFGIMLFWLLIACPNYTSDIDIFMQSVLYGISGADYNSHLVFSNIIFGKVMKVFLQIVPGIAWYTVFQYAGVMIALCTIAYVFLYRQPTIVKKIVLYVLLVFVGYECYVELSYAKTAAVLCAAGMSVLFDSVSYDPENKMKCVGMTVLLLASSLVSFNVFMIVGVIFVVGILAIHFKFNRFAFSAFMIKMIAITLLGIVITQAVDSYSYLKDENYTEIKTRQEIYEKIDLFGVPEYSESVRETTQLDASIYNLMVQGGYVTRSNNERLYLERIYNVKQSLDLDTVLSFFRTVPLEMVKVKMFFCCLFIVFLTCLSNRRMLRFLISVVTLCLITYFVFYMNNAWTGTAVSVIVFFPICILSLSKFGDISDELCREMVCYLVIGAFVLYPMTGKGINTKIKDDRVEIIFQELCENNDVIVIDLIGYLKEYNIFQVYTKDLLKDHNVRVVNAIYKNQVGFSPYVVFSDNPYITVSDELMGQPVEYNRYGNKVLGALALD